MQILIHPEKKLGQLIWYSKFQCLMFQIYKLNISKSKKHKRNIILLDGLDMSHNQVLTFVEQAELL